MIIILEGPDRSGKTEIGLELTKIINCSYFKNHYDVKNFYGTGDHYISVISEMFYLLNFLEQVPLKNKNLILDRFHLTEWAYANAYRRKTNKTLLKELDKKLTDFNSVVIYCYKNNYVNFDDDHVNINMIDKIKDSYHEILNESSLPILHLNTEDEILKREINEICNFLSKQKGGEND
jgi:thymidylate kinase